MLLHNTMMHILMSDSKKAQKDERLVFLKETVENADLHKVVLIKR